MTTEQTAKIVATLYEAFPNSKEPTDNTVMVWHMVLQAIDYRVAMAVLPEVIVECKGPYMPPPGAIVQKIRSLNGRNIYIDLWNEAERLISKGTILTPEEFHQASPEVQRYFRNVGRIRELALMPPEQTANERARFLREVPKIREFVKTRETLPDEVVSLIDGVAERKQLKGE